MRERKVLFPKLKETRLARGYTLKDLQRLLGYKSDGRYAMYESGDRKPNVTEALRIAKVLGETAEYLFAREEKPNGMNVRLTLEGERMQSIGHTVVGIVGAVHQESLRMELNYPLERMRSIILDFAPDVICGEVRPEDWDEHLRDPEYSGYLGPSEYRQMILPLCEDRNIEFVPVDWFENDLVRIDPFRRLTQEEEEQAAQHLGALYEGIFAAAKKSVIPGNSLEVDRFVQQKMEFLEKHDPIAQNILTTCRNQIMIERIKSAISTRYGKRILCTVGFEHNFFYYEGLRGEEWELVYPL